MRIRSKPWSVVKIEDFLGILFILRSGVSDSQLLCRFANENLSLRVFMSLLDL